MKIISINDRDIVFLSLFLTFGEIQPCLFEYLKRENLDLLLFDNHTTTNNNTTLDNETSLDNNTTTNNNTNNKGRLYQLSPRLKEECNYHIKNEYFDSDYFSKPTSYIVFKIPKNIPPKEVLRQRYNDTLFFCIDFLFNYLKTDFVSVLDDYARKHIDPNFTSTLHNCVNNFADTPDTFYDNNYLYFIVDSDLSRDLIIKFGFINLLNGKSSKMPYDELYYYFNTYNLSWIKYINGSYKKMIIGYLSYLSYYKYGKFLISFTHQNLNLLMIVRRLFSCFSNTESVIKTIGNINNDNDAGTYYDSTEKNNYYISLKRFKMTSLTNKLYDKLFECRNFFKPFNKDLISINQMFYYNCLLNAVFSEKV